MTPRAVHDHEPTLHHYVDLMISQLQARCSKSAELNTPAVVNIVDWMMFVVFDIIGDLAFAESFHCLENNSFHVWIKEIFSYFKSGALVVTLRYYASLYRLFMWCLPTTVLNAAENNYRYGVQKIHNRLNLEMQREDFMHRILQRNMQDDGKGMSVPEIESTMNVVIVAGSETCGTVLSGTINYLTKTPSVLEAFTNEVRSTFTQTEDITFANLKKLPYLNAVIEEGLRLCPPNPGALHHVVPLGGSLVCGNWFPEGTNISVHQYSLTRSSANFHRPDDFCPERWLESTRSDSSSPFYHDNLNASQAFSVGLWSCIGKYLAYQELRLVLAKLTWHFDLSRAEGGRDVDWMQQKIFALVEKQPYDVALRDVR
ncbi:hypothetical protein MMC13_007277 [Lambiella insularis]|nr:hypothetical protein [Lambiella insularis]